MEIRESVIDAVRAVGEVLGALKVLLWKIGNVFGKIGLVILRITELIHERRRGGVKEDMYRLVTEGKEWEDIEGGDPVEEEEDK